jgi:hypothetical protein
MVRVAILQNFIPLFLKEFLNLARLLQYTGR